ncbi:MAG: pyridoxal-dependent decarboxylase, exosortase A system-associated [Pseudomonadota bacterium]
MDQFGTKKNCLMIGGKSVRDLALAVGRTPFYVYDSGVISKQVSRLRYSMPEEIHLHYAIKANPMPAVVEHLANITDGLDVASAGELSIAIATGASPESISFAGPGKSLADLRSAITAGVIISVESEGEMHRIAKLASDIGVQPKVAVRVNPDFELKTSGMKMGGGPKPFGVDAERVPGMLSTLSDLQVEFIGFHVFSGSQNLRSAAIVEAQTKTFNLASQLSEATKQPVRWLNIGGGLGIPYFPGDDHIDLQHIADNLDRLITQARNSLPETVFVMELGRYLVAEAGIYVCEVVDKKTSRGQTYLITNGGLHHHLAASGNFGQGIRRNYPVCIGNRMTANEMETVSIVGPLCTPLDVLADKVTLPKAEVGDLVVVFQSGAYGYTASPRDFLSHPHPCEIIL